MISTLVIFVVCLAISVGVGVGCYYIIKHFSHSSHHNNPPDNDNFYPLKKLRKHHIHKLKPLKKDRMLALINALPSAQGSCIPIEGNASSCPTNPSSSPVTVVTTDPNDCVGWIKEFILKFPLYAGQVVTAETDPSVTFVPWKPNDVMGGDNPQNDMNIYMGVEGIYNNDIYIFAGMNSGINNDSQAQQEYGPGWQNHSDGAEYDVPPFNQRKGGVTAGDIEKILKVVLGPQNPAYKSTNGWVVVGYDSILLDVQDLPDCDYGCSVPEVNKGSGVFYFDQLRTALGLPTSGQN